MKPTTYKALDNAVPMFEAGHIYQCTTTSTRKLTFRDTKTGHSFTVYKTEFQLAQQHGKLVEYDDTQSEAMHAAVVSKLCHSLATRYIY